MSRVTRIGIVVLLLLVLASLAPLSVAAQPPTAPAAMPALSAAAATFTYIVLPGDTLTRIAARFGTTVPAILAANPQLTNANRIYVGQRLLIPIGGTTPGAERISFAAGTTSATRTDTVAGGVTKRYVFRAGAGQVTMVDVFSNGGSAQLAIIGANGRVVMSFAAGVTSFRAPLPTSQDYFIEVRSATSSALSYTLQLIIPQRISFARGAVSASLAGSAPQNGTHNYVLRAAAGQLMTISIPATAGQVILIVYGNDGSVLQSDHVGSSSFSGRLPLTEDYFLDVRAVGSTAARYQLNVRITN